MPLALNLNTEKARSGLVIAPVLVEFKLLHRDRVSLFSGFGFTVDEADGLKGRCDYILARSPDQLALTAPVCVLVEAKAENIVGGIPQCLAEMVAAQRFNRQAGEPEAAVYGAVTTGPLWRFLRLEGSRATVDAVEYPIQEPRRVFGILSRIALGPEAPARSIEASAPGLFPVCTTSPVLHVFPGRTSLAASPNPQFCQRAFQGRSKTARNPTKMLGLLALVRFRGDDYLRLKMTTLIMLVLSMPAPHRNPQRG